MPNHITNKLRLEGSPENIKKVWDYIKGEEEGQYIDFRKIATPPNYIFMGGLDLDMAEIFKSNKKESGFMTETDSWASWCVRYWGTKWNAYGLDKSRNTENTIYFQTAWSGIPRIVALLSEQFPNVDFFYSYADEDFASNTGFLNIFSRDRLNEYVVLDDKSKEAFDLAAELIGAESKYGKYIWDEEKQTIYYIDYEE